MQEKTNDHTIDMTKKDESENIEGISSRVGSYKDLLSISSEKNSVTDNESKQNSTKRPRKKRKVFSCETCRKFKTRCDFEPLVGKCHRCSVLDIHCSLSEERKDEIVIAIEKNPLKPSDEIDAVNADVIYEPDSKNIQTNESNKGENPLTLRLNERLKHLEDKVTSLNDKLDLLLLMQGASSATTSAKEILSNSIGHDNTNEDPNDLNLVNFQNNISQPDHSPTISNTRQDGFSEFYKLKEPPLKIINDIDERLFPLAVTSKKEAMEREQRPSAVARIEFLQFYEKNSSICLTLCREFLVRSHFWVIPGGIKELNDEFVRNHLFITSVFTIIAMSSSDNEKYYELQEVLYPLVERLLTNTLTMFDKLTVHDIEAILYCCMFHISRKAKRHRQLKINSMLLANFALFNLMNNIDFYKLKERVFIHEEYNPTDLYHLRVLNSLTACYLRYSIAYGSMATQDKMLKEFNNLIAKFPQANFGDDIKLSEINLSDIVSAIFIDFETYFNRFSNKLSGEHEQFDQKKLLVFPELNYWLKNWEELLAKDGGGILLFTYDFYHVMICRSFLTEFLDRIKENPQLLTSIIFTMKEYIFSLLKGFLRLPSSLIKGAPILTTNDMIYACMSLCDYLNWFEPSEKQEVLSICTRVYWHLNTIGEKLNEVTENVGKIIKYIITTAKNRANMGQFAPSFIDISTFRHDTKSISDENIRENIEDKSVSDPIIKSSPEQKIVNINKSDDTIDSPKMLKSQSEANLQYKSGSQFSMPDVDRFNSFEDFFQDFFNHLKPATQKMFSSSEK